MAHKRTSERRTYYSDLSILFGEDKKSSHYALHIATVKTYKQEPYIKHADLLILTKYYYIMATHTVLIVRWFRLFFPVPYFLEISPLSYTMHEYLMTFTVCDQSWLKWEKICFERLLICSEGILS